MSVDPVLFALLAGMEAQIEVVKVQATAIRQRLATLGASEAPARQAPVRLELPARCADIPARVCGLRNEDSRIDRDAFGVIAWECRGCGHREELGAGEASVNESVEGR